MACTTPSSKEQAEVQPLFLNFTSDLSPLGAGKKKSTTRKKKKQSGYRVNGVNILNRTNVETSTAIERMQRRRETHNHIERRRRDNINNIIHELSTIIPNAAEKHDKVNVLRLSLDYIKELQRENKALKSCRLL